MMIHLFFSTRLRQTVSHALPRRKEVMEHTPPPEAEPSPKGRIFMAPSPPATAKSARFPTAEKDG